MEKYVHKKEFMAKYSDVDFKDELKPSAMLTFLQEVSCTSADELGFGYEVIKPKNLGFVTCNTYVKIYKPIGIEGFKISTWPTPPRHVIFERQYKVENSAGELAAAALSRWCLVNMANFAMLPATTLSDQDYSTYNTDKVCVVSSWKVIPFEEEKAEKRFIINIANSEYDHYMHVNNTRYADYMFNCFSVAELKENAIDSFQINYLKQAHEGDSLTFYRLKESDSAFAIYGLNGTGDIITSGRVSFTQPFKK